MGEHKLKPIPVRPDMAIMRLKQTIGASTGLVLDAETKRYMADLRAVMDWMDHCEAVVVVEPEVAND